MNIKDFTCDSGEGWSLTLPTIFSFVPFSEFVIDSTGLAIASTGGTVIINETVIVVVGGLGVNMLGNVIGILYLIFCCG